MPATIMITVVKGEIEGLSDVADVVLDFERQLNNLKFTLGPKEIKVGPRFHISGDINEYRFLSNGTLTLHGESDSENQG